MASTGQEQYELALEPVVTFSMPTRQELLEPRTWTTLPTLRNVSNNHAKCRLELRIYVCGEERPLPRAYNGVEEWTVQPRTHVRRRENLSEIVSALPQLLILDHLIIRPEKLKLLGVDERQFLTADITVTYTRANGQSKGRCLGPLQLYFSLKEREWLPRDLSLDPQTNENQANGLKEQAEESGRQ